MSSDEISPSDLDLPTPRESKEELSDVSAYLEASCRVERPIEVLGSVRDGEGHVSISMGPGRDIKEAGFCIGFSPERARELAEALQDRADYAEEYAEAMAEAEATADPPADE